jgi:hypothetical protein
VLKLGRGIKIVTRLQKPRHMLTHYTDSQMVGYAAATNIGVWVVIVGPPVAQCAPAMLMALEVNACLDQVDWCVSWNLIACCNSSNRLNTRRTVPRDIIKNRDFRLPPRCS